MAKQKIETSIEINGIDVVAYPLVESDHVTFENGMTINEMIKGDVATPVVNHEEISFKVGKGDSDVSSSIVDSSVGEMTIKGQTYQNILPDPSLRNSMNKGKPMQKFNEGYDNVNVVDGVGKSAILKGQTLVNLILNGGEKKEITYSVSTKAKYYFNKSMIKDNVDFLLIYEVTNFEGDIAHISFNNSNNLGVSQSQFNKNGIYKTKVNFSDRSSIKDFIIFYKLTGRVLGGFISNVMLIEYQEGMEDWDIPYFEGMKSVQSPSLASVGKNLFNPSYTQYKTIDDQTGDVVDGNMFDYAHIDFEPIIGGIDIKVSNNIDSNGFFFYEYDKDKKIIKHSWLNQLSRLSDNTRYYKWRLVAGNGNINNAQFFQLEPGTQATPYEPHKSNTLTTPSDLTLRGIGDVCDTLDLVSGEKVERIGEVVFDGRENWRTGGWANQTDTIGFETQIGNARISRIFKGMSDKLSYTDNFNLDKECFTVVATVHGEILVGIRILRSKLSSEDVSGLEKYLQSNPIPIQYELETPIVKTVDLSSSGNWEKVVLDGSEDEGWGKTESTNSYTKSLWFMPSIEQLRGGGIFCDKLPTTINGNSVGVRNSNSGGIYIHISKDSPLTVREWVSQNAPITVWYQTTTHKDSTQVKQPLSFSNGHIQLSSEEGSLIPSLDYEVSTSNSYHLDLAKTSTQYTMKNMSGTFTIDNNNYNASANSAFTTPTSMANKLMITSVVQSNVMLLEGDLTSKTIPYFKGIKSAFEGEDEIEVLSVGKNLFDNSRVNNYLAEYLDNGYVKITGGKEGDIFAEQRAKPLIKPNTKYTITVDIIENTMAGVFEVQYSGDKRASLKSSFYIDTGFVGKISKTCNSKEVIENELVLVPKVIKQNTSGHVIFRIIVEETSTPTSYEPYKSNITKIPLSSPLRSLPNGVRDEVVLDRENNKVKVVQRVGEIKLNGSDDENWAVDMLLDKNTCSNMMFKCFNIKNIINYDLIATGMLCDKFTQVKGGDLWAKDVTGVASSNGEGIKIGISKSLLVTHDTLGFRQWLSKNLVEVQYQLATPIITEIDLDGYPYVYKDGHIFLNSEIAPTTTMKYSINQSHQIASQNGDLIRHEKEINYLYTLIAKYVNVQYESTLLNLDLELSRA